LSGDFVLAGAIGGVAETDAAAGAPVAIAREPGNYTLPKATGEVWAFGDALYWDATAKKFTKTSAGNTRYGAAAAAALTGDTSGAVFTSPA
jgi:predicted RecA/RadA family phage recombinase